MDVKTDYGALILGGLFAFGLSGCVNMQFVVYWQLYTGDRWTTKSLVTVTWFLDFCHSAFIAVALWDSIIAFYGESGREDVIPWSVGPTVELTATLTFLVQSFFAYRIYRLQNNKVPVAGLVFILAFIRLVAASVSMVEMLILQSYTVFARPFPSWFFTLGLSLSAIVDIMIAAFLSYSLRANRSDIQSTNRIIDTLTLWTIQTGSATCLGAIATLICWLGMRGNRVFLGLHFVVGKLYANSLLATLNARTKIRNSRKHDMASRLVPIPMYPDNAYRDQEGEGGPATPATRRLCHMRVEAFGLLPTNLRRSKSIQVRVQRTVEAKYDNEIEIDDIPMTAKSAPEGILPQVE